MLPSGTFVLTTVVLSCCRLLCAGPHAAWAQTTSHRAIIVSFDGFSEPWLRTYADSAAAPHLWRMFQRAECADAVRPAFPSVTPTGHASIWTGAYARVNGISASANGTLPWPETTILDVTDGFSAAALRAEPIWLTAARQGKTVFSHMATQSPQPPAYPPMDRSTPALDSARARAARGDTLPNLAVLNVYNGIVSEARVVTSPGTWALGADGDSLAAAVRDDSTVVVTLNHDPAHSVRVSRAATDTTSPATRPLARWFSAPLRVDLRGGRRTFIYFRLFELSPDRSHMMLFVSEARVVQGNRPSVAAEHDSAVEGVPETAPDD